MSKKSAGILAWRMNEGVSEVLLAHPGGPFFKNKDAGAWSVPKGEIEEGEDALQAARREFAEETGLELSGTFVEMRQVKQKGGKVVVVWCVNEQDLDISLFQSNTFTMEWPPRSGKMTAFPEIDKIEWFGLAEAREKINAAQATLLDELAGVIAEKG